MDTPGKRTLRSIALRSASGLPTPNAAKTASYTTSGDASRLLERRSGNKGKREFIQVLRLMEVFDQELVAASVAHAIKLGALSFDAVKQIALAQLERRPPRLDLEQYPHLPKAHVRTTRAADYTALTAARAA